MQSSKVISKTSKRQKQLGRRIRLTKGIQLNYVFVDPDQMKIILILLKF